MSKASSGKRTQADVDRLQGEIADLRASRRRLAVAAQADRRAIERDLHDGVQQHLVAIAVELQGLSRLVAGDQGAARAALVEIRGIVREAVDQAAKLATMVYPQSLGGRGFASALRSAANDAGITVLVDVPANADYPAEIATVVYWTFRDAVSSASAGSETAVHVSDVDGGVAFEITIAERHAEAVLERLRDRVEALDGRLDVEDREGVGSRLQGWLPLPG